MNIITRLKSLRLREHEFTIEIIESLVQCNREKAYLEHACSSTRPQFAVDICDAAVLVQRLQGARSERRLKLPHGVSRKQE